MDLYRWNQETGEFTGTILARVDPAEAARGVTKYRKPAFATELKPPNCGENEVAIWAGSEWEITPDFRGQAAYKKTDGSQVLVEQIGEPGDDLVLIDPKIDFPTWDETSGTWVEDTDKRNDARVAEIKAELQALDLSAVRPLRALAAGTGTAEDAARLADLETQAQALRAELATLS